MKTQDHLHDREFALALAMKDVAAELRLVDPADYVGYVRMEQYSNLEDIINSSSELLFQPGTLTFGWGADIRLSWSDRPRIFLDMEFRYESVTVFFSLGLSGEARIRLDSHDHFRDSGRRAVDQHRAARVGAQRRALRLAAPVRADASFVQANSFILREVSGVGLCGLGLPSRSCLAAIALAQLRQSTIAGNISNVSTPGYRAAECVPSRTCLRAPGSTWRKHPADTWRSIHPRRAAAS